ncbi:dihydroorotate dehydrogenase electron transfer subunit [Alicyclobacillus fastidiosus]|uniref:Dihydroorotate dehydrogenase electron transfer subunit n=1 Tax=Alicyclobacillus fastidiosus TaxID=392011 RepID=A0ABY6ZJJ6_9BACL|nr:dihydroorotate dehydrogenase electron transfer subunit [Alicyclobacillus fastidiosus]WAH43103.1 dihydroorotate dehydrogenase electron transfer subunit [Alicyclobacillus fastidiosus]GMA65102.1 dihydroorotate dehydrogenase B (NAD(+)), electron transfer subunit [Alicyclobacillus fastidiosus]
MKQVLGRVLQNEWVNERYKHMVVYAPEVAAACMPGQFFHIRCDDQFTPLLRRPMSIYQYNADYGEVHFLYSVKGNGTTLLAEKKIDDLVDLFGPLGKGFQLDPHWRSILVVARGVGLATLAPLTRLAAKHGIQTHAILSARTAEDVLSRAYMEANGAYVNVVTDADGSSDMHHVEALLHNLIKETPIDALFTCGSRRLTNLLRRVALEHKLPGQVALEENMGCAIGMCFCCVKPFLKDGKQVNLRVCADGPVFDLQEVMEA